MKPDHEAALAKCRAWPHKSNTAACYLDAMARLDKAEKERDGWKDAYFELIRAIGSTPGNSKSPVSIAHELMARLDKATELLRAALDRSECYDEDHVGEETATTRAIRAFLERKTDDKQS